MRKFQMTNVLEFEGDSKKVMNLYKIHDDFIKLCAKYDFKCSGELKEIK